MTVHVAMLDSQGGSRILRLSEIRGVDAVCWSIELGAWAHERERILTRLDDLLAGDMRRISFASDDWFRVSDAAQAEALVAELAAHDYRAIGARLVALGATRVAYVARDAGAWTRALNLRRSYFAAASCGLLPLDKARSIMAVPIWAEGAIGRTVELLAHDSWPRFLPADVTVVVAASPQTVGTDALRACVLGIRDTVRATSAHMVLATTPEQLLEAVGTCRGVLAMVGHAASGAIMVGEQGVWPEEVAERASGVSAAIIGVCGADTPRHLAELLAKAGGAHVSCTRRVALLGASCVLLDEVLRRLDGRSSLPAILDAIGHDVLEICSDRSWELSCPA